MHVYDIEYVREWRAGIGEAFQEAMARLSLAGTAEDANCLCVDGGCQHPPRTAALAAPAAHDAGVPITRAVSAGSVGGSAVAGSVGVSFPASDSEADMGGSGGSPATFAREGEDDREGGRQTGPIREGDRGMWPQRREASCLAAFPGEWLILMLQKRLKSACSSNVGEITVHWD